MGQPCRYWARVDPFRFGGSSLLAQAGSGEVTAGVRQGDSGRDGRRRRRLSSAAPPEGGGIKFLLPGDEATAPTPGTDATTSGPNATTSPDGAAPGTDAGAMNVAPDATPDAPNGSKGTCEAGVCPTVIAPNQNFPIGIAVDSTNVYGSGGGTADRQVLKCAIGGCSQTPTALVTGQNATKAIAVDGANVTSRRTATSTTRGL